MSDYIFDFIKIEKLNPITGVGTAGNIAIVLNTFITEKEPTSPN